MRPAPRARRPPRAPPPRPPRRRPARSTWPSSRASRSVTVTRPGTTRRGGRPRADRRPDGGGEAARRSPRPCPRRTALRGVSVADGVATVDLGRRFASGRKAEVLSARVAQLVLTATAVPGVDVGPAADRRRHPARPVPRLRDEVPDHRGGRARRGRPRARRSRRRRPRRTPAPSVRALQDRLADLGFLPRSGVDGQAGEQTRFAVHGLPEVGAARPRRRRRPAHARGARAARSGRRRARRAPAAASRSCSTASSRSTSPASRVVRTLHVSTGAAGFATPDGPLQRLPQGAQLVVGARTRSGCRGRATSSAASPSTSRRTCRRGPASHGCVRVPRYDAQWLYDRLPNGTAVTVLASS